MADYNNRRSNSRRQIENRNHSSRNRRRNDSYIHGNVVTAPQYEEAPRRSRVYRDGKRVADTKKGIRYREAMAHYSLPYCFVICVLVAVTIYLGILSIKVNNDVTKKQDSINQLEQEINILTSENEVYNYNVNSYVDTDYIIKTAKKKLGMVEAKPDQINYYKKSSSEYMKQLEDIPEK